MTIIDRVKKIFSRSQPPAPIALGTGISAPWSGSQSYGNGSKYPGGVVSPLIVGHDHLRLRQSVRDLMYDSMEARSLVNSIVDTTIETGLMLKPTPDAAALGITPEFAEQWADQVAASFHLWAKSKKSHRPRVNNFYQNQRLYELFKQRDNDIFVRLYYGRDKDLTNPLQIDFIDPNQIRGYAYSNTYYQFPHDDGIVRDGSGREISYKYWQYNADGTYTDTVVPAIGEKSGRVMMLHGFNPEYAGQGRGYPRMSHLIQELSNLTGFKASVIQKAINQSGAWAAIENEVQDASQPLAGRVAGPIRDYGTTATDTVATTNPVDTEPVINFKAVPEASITVPGSLMIGNLRRGDKLKYLQDTSPGPQYESFEKSFFSSIAASLGWSIEVVRKQFNNNYSASRATLLLIWRTAQIERDETAADFLDPVYEMWIAEEIAAGRVSCPGWSDPRLRAAWLCCEWAGAPMPNIDPVKSAAADKEYVALGAQTLDDVARNYNGSSGKANRAKNARQFQELPAPPWNAVAAPAPIEDNEKPTEEDKA